MAAELKENSYIYPYFYGRIIKRKLSFSEKKKNEEKVDYKADWEELDRLIEAA